MTHIFIFKLGYIVYNDNSINFQVPRCKYLFA